MPPRDPPPTGNPFFDALGRIALSFQAAPQGMPGVVWDELRPWITRLTTHAVPKWLPRLTMGFPCAVPVYESGRYVGPCVHGAMAICDVCSQACCLGHCRIDSFGDAICYLCVAHAVRTRSAASAANGGQPPPGWNAPPPQAKQAPHADEIAWARKILKVKATASADEIKTAWRKLSAEWHPDKHQGERAKAKAEAKFKEIQRAADLLKQANGS